jgi:hypothetical protein
MGESVNDEVSQRPPVPRFQLSWVNKLLYGIFAIVNIVSFIKLPDRNPAVAGKLIADLLILPLIPLALAWVAWRVSRRRLRVARITFNVVFIWLVLGLAYQRLEEKRLTNDLVVKMVALKGLAASTNTVQVSGEARVLLMDVASNFHAQAELSAGSEKQVLQVVGDFLSEVSTKAQTLAKSKSLFEQGIVEHAGFKSREGLEDLIHRCRECLTAAEQYCDLANHLDERFLAAVSKTSISPDTRRQVLEGYREALGTAYPSNEEVCSLHELWVQKWSEVFRLLKDNWGLWKYDQEAGNVVFDDVTTLGRYQTLVGERRELAARLDKAQEEQMQKLRAWAK